jgi:hypothetical protein
MTSAEQRAQAVDVIIGLVDQLAQAEATIADLRAQLADATPRRCSDCGRGARQLIEWREDGEVVAWLGPTCYRRRMDAAGTAQPFPLGGAR